MQFNTTEPKELTINQKEKYTKIGYILLFTSIFLTLVPIIKFHEPYIVWGQAILFAGLYLIFRARGKSQFYIITIIITALLIFYLANSSIGFYYKDKSLRANLEVTKGVIVKSADMGGYNELKYKSIGYEFISINGDRILSFSSVSLNSPMQVGDSIVVGYDKTNIKNAEIYSDINDLTERLNSNFTKAYFESDPNHKGLYLMGIFAILISIYSTRKTKNKP